MYQKICSYLFLASLLLSTPLTVWSSENFQFDRSNISLRGSGCPPQTYSLAYTDDLQTMSILFDEFSASVPQFDGINENDDVIDGKGELKSRKNDKFLQRKICTFRLAALVPEGQFIDSIDVQIDFRGAALLDPGTTARFRSILVSRGGVIKNKTKNKYQVTSRKWRAKKQALEDDFYIHSKKTIPINSACAVKKDRRARLVFKNVITAKIRKKNRTSNTNRSASIFIDSADIVGTFSVKVNLSKC